MISVHVHVSNGNIFIHDMNYGIQKFFREVINHVNYFHIALDFKFLRDIKVIAVQFVVCCLFMSCIQTSSNVLVYMER